MKTAARKSATKKSSGGKKAVKQKAVDRVPVYATKTAMKTTPVPVPEHTSYSLPNGLKVLLVPRKRLPVFQAALMLKSGSLLDPAGKAGCTNLTGLMLNAGTSKNGKSLNRLQLAELIDSIGGSLSINIDHSRMMISFSGLSKFSDTILDILTDITRYPSIPPDEVTRERQQLLASLVAKKDQPGWLAEDALLRRIYPNHPMGLPTEGLAETVSGLTRENVIEHWKMLAQPEVATLAITGDFDVKEIKQAISAHFEDWKSDATIPTIPNPEQLSDEIEIILVNKPGAVQSSIELGHHGISRKHPDFYALVTLEQILFSGMSSRFYKVIRAERGLTYSIYGGFEAGKFAGPLSIVTSTMKERTGYMVSSIFEVIEKFLAGGPTTKELLDAQLYLTGSYPLRFETSGAVTSSLLSLDWVGLPDSVISEYRSRIASLTKQDILRAAREHIHPERLRVAIVGEIADIEPQLSQIGRKFLITKL